MISSNKTVADASWLMKSHRIGGLPVVDGGKLVGVITVVDINRVRGKEHSTKVRDVMTRNSVVAYPEEDVLATRQRMRERRIGRLPVVSRQDSQTLLGMIFMSQLLNYPNLAYCEYCDDEFAINSIKNGKCPNDGSPLDANTTRRGSRHARNGTGYRGFQEIRERNSESPFQILNIVENEILYFGNANRGKGKDYAENTRGR